MNPTNPLLILGLGLALGCTSPTPTPPGSSPLTPDTSPPPPRDAQVDADAPRPSDGSPSVDADCVPSREICDGLDNDCDPATEDGADSPCPDPPGARGRCDGEMGCAFSCRDGFADCNADPSDGCEVELASDPAHCGACDAACPDEVSCTDGSCTPAPITIDGVLGPGEWAGAVMADNTRETDWGIGLNALQRVRARIDSEQLAIAIEGRVESTNAIIVYVDSAADSGVCDLFGLTDGTGLVDDPLSAGLTTPSTFCADYGWATRGMSRMGVGLEDGIGWRDLVRSPGDFGWINADLAPSHCGESVCETRLPLSGLGLAPGAEIRLFVRLGNRFGTAFSNQSLPEDSGENPAEVMRLLSVPVP